MRYRMRLKSCRRFSRGAAAVALGYTTLVSDTFTGTNGTSLAAHTPNVGGPWTVAAGTFVISSNKAKGNTTGSNIAVIDAGRAGLQLQADVTLGTSAAAALVARYSATTDFLAFGWSNGNFVLVSTVGGSSTTLASASTGGATSGTLRMVLQGNQVSCFFNGGLLLTGDDQDLFANTVAGVEAVKVGSAPDATFDNFLVQSLGF